MVCESRSRCSFVVVASASDLLPVADHLSVLDGNLAKLVNDNTVLQTALGGTPGITVS